MEKVFDPHSIEQRWAQFWEEKPYFQPSFQGVPYCIMIPPPNVTGYLHMGHGFQQTLMDALIRYHRMMGQNTLWQPGTDHAGIATQMVVERQLLEKDIRRTDLGRDAFLEKVWEWKETSGNQIGKQQRRLGTSLDWTRERFTMDPELSDAVKEAFVRLYREGLIYRGKRLVNWDPVLQTAISDLEVVNEEVDSHLWFIRYPLVNGSGALVVATTRPETMLGDVAVAVHPEDERYQPLIGQHVHLPLCDRTIPIIADTYVDKEFGTGCVKITPAHDFNDYAVGERHRLPCLNILTKDAHINDTAPLMYRGLDRFAARKQIVMDLEKQGFIEKITAHKMMVPKGDRTHVVLEPFLTDQWFVRTKPLAEPAITAVEQGKIRFIPEAWSKTYFQWLYNIEDWCISRQLWWGHRIPAWYDDAGNIYVGRDEKEIRQHYGLSNDKILKQDDDVLDTWFSSALWPFSTLGWPKETAELVTFYPSSVLVTGFDIIFFWVARMVMFGLKFMKDVPFREVYITGLIRDSEGRKMSKSQGNVLDPLDLIDGIDLASLIQKRTSGLMQPQMAKRIEAATRKEFPDGIPNFGTDALRFTYCSMANTAREICFDLNRVQGYRNFCNKLWNAARYVLMNVSDEHVPLFHFDTLNIVDRWIFSRYQQLIQEVHSHFREYRFDLLANALYEFIWKEYCDWYLELTKSLLKEGNDLQEKQKTQYTMVFILEGTLRLLHPIMPFISEEIWQSISKKINTTAESLMISTYPIFSSEQIDETATVEIEWLKQVVIAIRTARSEMNISPAKQISVVYRSTKQIDVERWKKYQEKIFMLCRIQSGQLISFEEKIPASTSCFVDALEIYIPLSDLTDLKSEIERLQKEILKLKKEENALQTKMQNENFIKNAPAVVVDETKNRLQVILDSLDKFESKVAQLMKQ